MISRPRIIVHAAPMTLIALFITLYPAAAWLQEPAETPAPQETRSEPAVPDQGAAAPSAQEARATEAAGSYTVKQGDTLWDISNTFLKDPFLWPLIWKSNPGIANPDLIYPGQILAIPSLAPVERAMSAPQEAAPAEEEMAVQPEAPREGMGAAGAAPLLRRQRPAEAAPETVEEAPKGSRLILPEEAQQPIVDKYSMINAGFVNLDETDDEITGSVERKSIVGYDDLVYISVRSRENVAIGDRFLIYHPQNAVKHPVTGERYGRLIKILGILKVTARNENGMYTARITLSFDAAEEGSLITPYQEPSLIYDSGRKQSKTLSGYILEVTDRRTINAQTDIVYLDRGQVDGVEPGDRFLVYSDPTDKNASPKLVGEVQVFLVKERTSTAVVRKSVDYMTRGERIEYKN